MRISNYPLIDPLTAWFGLLSWFMIATTATAASSAIKSPEITHTRKAPTGYSVTFRYVNRSATTVKIRGEWYFARPSELPRLAGTPEHPIVEGQGILPKDWRPGDFPLQHPNSTGSSFPVVDMIRDSNGVWTYTTPLPSGVFSYGFLVDCSPADPDAAPAPGQPPCRAMADPSNKPWNEAAGTVNGNVANSSQVYVPADPDFNTVDYSWQSPARRRGALSQQTYASPGHQLPSNQNHLIVYTPPDYNAQGVTPYPTLYLSHGGGDNEMGWSTKGVAQNILDNLINSGEVSPMVVVMPNASGYPPSDYFEAFDRDLIEHMIPYIERHYNVSKFARDRAFAGLSMGGQLTNTFMIKHPEVFQYYGMMSAGLPAKYGTLTPEQIAGLRGKAIWIGSGWQDSIHVQGFRTADIEHTGPAREVSTFARAGIPTTTTFINGGHNWYVWRQLLRDFLLRTAFKPLPYAE